MGCRVGVLWKRRVRGAGGGGAGGGLIRDERVADGASLDDVGMAVRVKMAPWLEESKRELIFLDNAGTKALRRIVFSDLSFLCEQQLTQQSGKYRRIPSNIASMHAARKIGGRRCESQSAMHHPISKPPSLDQRPPVQYLSLASHHVPLPAPPPPPPRPPRPP